MGTFLRRLDLKILRYLTPSKCQGIVGICDEHSRIATATFGSSAANSSESGGSQQDIQAVTTRSRLVDNSVTHTGQRWAENDWRNARFELTSPKRCAPPQRFAINLVHEVAPKPCLQRVVHCDGGGGPLGHPRVYINLDKPGNHVCGYCGLRFYLAGHAAHDSPDSHGSHPPPPPFTNDVPGA